MFTDCDFLLGVLGKQSNFSHYGHKHTVIFGLFFSGYESRLQPSPPPPPNFLLSWLYLRKICGLLFYTHCMWMSWHSCGLLSPIFHWCSAPGVYPMRFLNVLIHSLCNLLHLRPCWFLQVYASLLLMIYMLGQLCLVSVDNSSNNNCKNNSDETNNRKKKCVLY